MIGTFGLQKITLVSKKNRHLYMKSIRFLLRLRGVGGGGRKKRGGAGL